MFQLHRYYVIWIVSFKSLLTLYNIPIYQFLFFKPDSKPLELTLFHSSDWKADGPVQITPLMRMIADVEKKKCGSEKPVIVMCE